MGISGYFWRNKKSGYEELSETKKEIHNILNNLSYQYYDCNEKGADFCTISINGNSDGTSHRNFVMRLYSRSYWNNSINEYSCSQSWLDMNYYLIISIEDVSDCGDMVLEILHEYLKQHYNDIFDTDMDRQFTKVDVDKIYENGDCMNWIYTV